MKPKNTQKTALVIGCVVILMLIAGCSHSVEASSTVAEDVTAREAYELIEANQGGEAFVILDVRTPGEFAEGHIEGAINIDYRGTSFRDRIDDLARDYRSLIYCRSGNRSQGALTVMSELGFHEIYHLAGGIIEWSEAGLPLTRR